MNTALLIVGIWVMIVVAFCLGRATASSRSFGYPAPQWLEQAIDQAIADYKRDHPDYGLNGMERGR